MPKLKMTDEEFARIWNDCPNTSAFCERTGYGNSSIRKKANDLIEKGFDMKEMPHPRARIFVKNGLDNIDTIRYVL